VRLRRRTLTRLKLLLALVVLAAAGGAALLYLAAPQVALLVGGVGIAIAIAGYVLHRSASMLLASIVLYPILALGIYSLHVVLGVPAQYLMWISVAVFALVVVVLGADEIPI
jgi:hypothetical protein